MYRFSALSILLLNMGAAEVAGREWWDNTGRYRVEAEFVSSDGRTAHLRRGDGSTIAVPLERLSEADRTFVQNANQTPAEHAPAQPDVGQAKRLFAEFLQRSSRETFLAARQAIMALPKYDAYSTDLFDLEAHFRASRFGRVIQEVTDNPNFWLSPRAHLLASAAAQRTQKSTLAAEKRRIAERCLEAILNTGDGSMTRPYLVTRQLDQYDVLDHLQKELSSQQLWNTLFGPQPEWIDALTCTDGSEICFDVSDLIKFQQSKTQQRSED